MAIDPQGLALMTAMQEYMMAVASTDMEQIRPATLRMFLAFAKCMEDEELREVHALFGSEMTERGLD